MSEWMYRSVKEPDAGEREVGEEYLEMCDLRLLRSVDVVEMDQERPLYILLWWTVLLGRVILEDPKCNLAYAPFVVLTLLSPRYLRTSLSSIPLINVHLIPHRAIAFIPASGRTRNDTLPKTESLPTGP